MAKLDYLYKYVLYLNKYEVIMARIFIILSSTNTTLARAIRKCAGTEFSHTSLALDNNFEEMFSFSRRKTNNPLIGRMKKESFDTGIFAKSKDCLCQVYTAKVTDDQMKILKNKVNYFLNSKKEFKFNNLGLFACWFKIKFPRKYKRVCSQFVSECLTEACPEIILPKHYWIMQPEDFKYVKNIDLIYRGNLKNIPRGLSEEEIEAHKELYKDYNPDEFKENKKKRKK